MAARLDEVIDLSDSFVLADHRAFNNDVIELDTDDSGLIECDTNDSVVELVEIPSSLTITEVRQAVQSRKPDIKKGNSPLGYTSNKYKTEVKKSKINDKLNSNETQMKFGECPICFDLLGQNPLASTKCGHVYCMKCIERYLQFDKKCPTCRQILRGKTAYHPLYLNR
ncbi:unnamed protein product [Arctia plantaginis]|uniref:RING-type domain-containing protein n=1 Tax=Arctia plantaginis TaxID=874455 RepID=A0A8S1A2E0_ARCPL|nr:unnamed protein product [Arctia plantaginis]